MDGAPVSAKYSNHSHPRARSSAVGRTSGQAAITGFVQQMAIPRTVVKLCASK